MKSIMSLSYQCLAGFETLRPQLEATKPENLQLMPGSTIENQLGKFRVWCGNLGALQMGYASLDYRLRESVVMQTNVSKLLQQLNVALEESFAVVSGARLPFEEQARPPDLSEEESTDGSDSEEEPTPVKELSLRLSSIIDIQKNLYQLGYKIRDPSLRPISNKAASLKQIDPETNIDVFERLGELDRNHLSELLSSLRQGRSAPDFAHDFLAERLAASTTLRRKYFKYWDKHTKKLYRVTKPVDILSQPDQSYSQYQPTDATPYDPNLDDRTERGTIVSFASTAVDTSGKGIEIPKPPIAAVDDQPFTCPYCAVLCPPKQGQGKAWKAHVLHDLQPYVCTYRDCTRENELFRSRSRWLEHEMVHRRGWRCRDHPEAIFSSSAAFRSHLRHGHSNKLTNKQIDDLVEFSAVSRADDRESCPICFQRRPFPKGLANHVANHLERIALFALPMTVSDVEGAENQSQASKQILFGSQRSTIETGSVSSTRSTQELHNNKGKEEEVDTLSFSNLPNSYNVDVPQVLGEELREQGKDANLSSVAGTSSSPKRDLSQGSNLNSSNWQKGKEKKATAITDGPPRVPAIDLASQAGEIPQDDASQERPIQDASAPSNKTGPAPPADPPKDMWTEITKELVVREAIEEVGYEYEETEMFFYIMDYLKYDDVLHLVEISDEIRRARKQRARELEWEREHEDDWRRYHQRHHSPRQEEVAEDESSLENRSPPGNVY